MEDKKFEHLMIDIETMGNESFSAILSIAALEFDIETGETGKSFEVNIDLQSCFDIGLIANASTILWWLDQNEAARKKITQAKNPINIIEALTDFARFCDNKDYQIWGNSPRFDLGIMRDAYKKMGWDIPWNFRKERDLRTLVALNPKFKTKAKNTGVQHDPLDDCRFQIEYAVKTWNSLKSITLVAEDTNKTQLKFKRLTSKAVAPYKKYKEDAGFDLTATWKEVTDNYIEYGTDLAFEIPVGYAGLVFPRSSVRNKDLMLKNSIGLIDSTYRGEIKLSFHETVAYSSNNYDVGDRVGQIVFIKLPDIELVESDTLSKTTRNTGGHGSTGN